MALYEAGKPSRTDANAEEGALDADVPSLALAEGRQGRALWQSIHRVVALTVNVRAPDVLARLQAEMRGGKGLSDEMWNLYMSRVMQRHDARVLASPFSTNQIHFIVHRHKIRAMRSL